MRGDPCAYSLVIGRHLSLLFAHQKYRRSALLKAITTHDTDLVELEALELRRAIQKLEHSYAPQQWVRRTIYVQAGFFFIAYVLLVGHFFFPLSWGCLS